MVTQHAHTGRSEFLEEVIEATPGGERIVHCLQCGSCGGSCPNGADMQYTPRTIFAMINANRKDEVLSANTMWCCVSCYFCTVRCPQNIPITEVMYALKRMSIAGGKAKESDAPALAKTFTDLVERYGRAYEVGIALLYLGMHKPLSALKAGPMGLSMFVRGRMGIFPQKIRQVEQLQAIIRKAREIGRFGVKYAYYPGCSLEKNSAAYDISVRAVSDLLGIKLVEIDDWNCCGATEYFSQDELVACSVIARNLALVDPQLDQVVAPCAACYLNLKKVDKLMAEDAKMSAKIGQALGAGGLKYKGGRLTVRHLLDVIYTDIGEAAVRDKVVRPLTGLRVAPYYGCQWVRPLDGVDNPEYPMKMDELFKWLGAEVVDYPVKAHCCGGHMTQISEPQAFELIRRLLASAVEYHADLILCMCPMCQLNMDGYQARVNGFFNTNFQIPIIFFTQMVGVAFGLDPAKLGFGKELVAARPVLQAKLGAAPAAAR